MNTRAGIDWSRGREKSMSRQHNLSEKCLSKYLLASFTLYIFCNVSLMTLEYPCSLCMIRVNGRSISRLLAGMMNP